MAFEVRYPARRHDGVSRGRLQRRGRSQCRREPIWGECDGRWDWDTRIRWIQVEITGCRRQRINLLAEVQLHRRIRGNSCFPVQRTVCRYRRSCGVGRGTRCECERPGIGERILGDVGNLSCDRDRVDSARGERSHRSKGHLSISAGQCNRSLDRSAALLQLQAGRRTNHTERFVELSYQ